MTAAKEATEGKAIGVGFFKEGGLLYRQWSPHHRDKGEAIKQLVLPALCRKAVLDVAHCIPMAGHLGRNKTAQHIYYAVSTGSHSTEM